LETAERRNKIEKIIREKKEIRTTELNNMVKISSVTLRNDLIYLERKGVIKRVFGAVSLIEGKIFNIPDIHDTRNQYEKEKIGKYAASMLQDGESVMIYTGSTGMQVVKNIIDKKNLILVTNSVEIAFEAGKNPYLKIVMLGGLYNSDTHSIFGQTAIEQFGLYKIDKLFLSIQGISYKNGVSSDIVDEIEMNKELIKKADKVIIIADHSKIGSDRFINIADIKEIDILVTDKKAPEEALERIRKAGVEVVVV
jgi:DeoR/GlpR family transcriptional regulator of sugar metabolism